MRSCIIETTRENRPIIEAHLPPGVTLDAVHEPFDKATIMLRLKGDGLPAWCERRNPGDYFVRATAEILDDGILRLSPGCGIPDQQIHPSIKA